MAIQAVVDQIIAGNLHEALVGCWRYFISDFPRFQKAETHALGSEEEYRFFKKKLAGLLIENEKLKLRNLTIDFPLAFLEVLDQYIFERFNRMGNPPPARVKIDDEFYYVRRRLIGYKDPPPHRRQTGHPQSWLTYHGIVPCSIQGIEIRIYRMPQTHRHLKVHEKDGKVTLFIGCFPDGVKPDWYERAPGAIVADVLSKPEKRWQSVKRELEYAAELNADIVVFPELTICPALRQKVSDWLLDHPDTPFSMVLPGSFHQRHEEKISNDTELFGRSGKAVLSHTKLTSFGDKNKREGNDTGDCINLLDTSIGLVGIPICLDFCEEGKPFNHLWEDVGADWLLVPAFGDDKSVRAHQRRADAVKRAHGTVCALANQNPNGEDKDHGFITFLKGQHLVNDGKRVCVSVEFQKTS